MFDLELAIRLGAALGLGLLLGLERERKRDAELLFGGVRTFALIALLGALGAYTERELLESWLIVAAFIAVSALVVMSYATTAARGDVGITTEISALLAFVVGALCGWDKVAVAIVVTVVCLLLLTLKDYLHRLARRVELADVEATLQFAVISLIILPLLPNETYGPPPIDVINPYKIWLMVVLIAGLNFLGYVLVKVFGSEHGFLVTGILGGLVSSTAVTLSFAQRSRREPAMSSAFALAIVVAWTIMFVRVVVIVALVNWDLARSLALTLGWVASASVMASLILWRRSRSSQTGVVAAGANPFELSEAIKFGLLFGVVTIAAKAAQVYLGAAGLYLAGALAGLTDVDAISLSMANLATTSPDSVKLAAFTIVIAVISNTLVKTGMAAFMGAPPLRRSVVGVTLLLCAAAGAGMLFA
ncbi:MAG TPA: MgtC/SapB family protein [Roseiflexaceae bacterium]|nr:MgtC/SapB family protein [Roseiflexaceae bacterium]